MLTLKYADVVAQVLELLVRFFADELKAKNFNYSFYAAMTFVFQFDSDLHKSSYQIAESDLKRLRTKD